MCPPGGPALTRAFIVVRTGDPLPVDTIRVCGTAVAPTPTWHLVEVRGLLPHRRVLDNAGDSGAS